MCSSDLSAQVITLDAVRAEAERLREIYGPGLAKQQQKLTAFLDPRNTAEAADPAALFDDYGRVAALLGYDAVLVEGDNPEYLVLNRGALRLPPQPSRAEWRRIGKAAREAANAR